MNSSNRYIHSYKREVIMVLDGKTVVVTGGTRGVGFQISKLFLENGARVLAFSRNLEKITWAKEQLPALETLQGDVSNPADVDRVAAWVNENWSKLDILVNNAGISDREHQGMADQPDWVFEGLFKTNVFGPYYATKRLLPALLKAQEPRLVMIGSITGIISPRLNRAYGVSKAALHALTIALANELKGRIAVNAMSPGLVRTDMAPDAPGDPQDSARTALWLVQQPFDFVGRLCRDSQEIDWTPMDIVEQLAALITQRER